MFEKIKKNTPVFKVGLGTMIAVLASYTTWHSIGWAALHGMCGWGYVIYYLIVY